MAVRFLNEGDTKARVDNSIEAELRYPIAIYKMEFFEVRRRL